MSQQKISEVNIVNTMNISTVKMCKGFKKGEYVKTQRHKVKVYQSGTTLTTLTMVITNARGAKGVGVAKCNPKDKFNLEFGLHLAEYRAREDFYKSLAEMYIKGC